MLCFISYSNNLDLQARMQRGNVRLKQGRLDEAYIDFEQVVSE